MCPDGEVPWMVDDPILGGQGWVDAHIVLAEHGLPVRCRGHAVLSSPRTQPEQVRGTSEPRVESGHDARLTCWMSRHDTAAGPSASRDKAVAHYVHEEASWPIWWCLCVITVKPAKKSHTERQKEMWTGQPVHLAFLSAFMFLFCWLSRHE